MTKRLLWLAAACLAACAALFAWAWAGLPARSEVRALDARNPGKTRLMLQREEEARAKGRGGRGRQSWVPLSAVSRHLIHAVLAAEDQKFFGHAGVDWRAIQDSIEKNVEKGRFARGGSTITQQLAKNLYFGTRKTPIRKLRELVVTQWLEADLGKARILALYLNVIEWGDFVYGCEAAAQRWYGKPAAALDGVGGRGSRGDDPEPAPAEPAGQRRAPRARHAARALADGAGRLSRARHSTARGRAAARDRAGGRGGAARSLAGSTRGLADSTGAGDACARANADTVSRAHAPSPSPSPTPPPEG